MKKTKLTKDSVVSQNPDILFSNIEGETVMMSIHKGEYYGLNPVSSRIWELIAAPVSIKQICDILMQEYEVSSEQCEHEVIDFL
ncbi:MAG: lasso peptide biosynthesis PqqD family chaperone, partial [Bacteroidia bacterium]|nr:lasso peptide biosynthesis PqqD family chaperone [Bacteroidia bacterium]